MIPVFASRNVTLQRRRYVFMRIFSFICIFLFLFVFVHATGKAHRTRTKFESGWEVGMIKAFDKKGLHAGKFSVKYKDGPNW